MTLRENRSRNRFVGRDAIPDTDSYSIQSLCKFSLLFEILNFYSISERNHIFGLNNGSNHNSNDI